MSAAVLVTGTLFKEPQQRTSQSGKRYVAATIKAAAEDNASSDFWSILCFSDSGQAELMRLGVNERLAVQGSLKIETYTKDGETKISRTVFVDSVMSLRAAPRDRKPKKPASDESLLVETPEKQTAGGPAFFDDDIPFEAAL
jgi:single-stranded DNA-binding protein